MEKDRFDILSRRVRGKLLALARSFALPSGVEPDDVVQEAIITLQPKSLLSLFLHLEAQ